MNIINSTAARLTLCAAAFAVAVTAQADPITMGNENRVIEPGVEYLIPSYQASSGIYTSPSDAKIYFDGGQDFKPYTDAAHTDEIVCTALDNTGLMKWFQPEAGKTYYFYTGFAFNRSIFTLYQDGVNDKPLEISIMQPQQNKTVDFKNYPDLQVTFNQDIKLTDAKATITFSNRLTGAKEEVNARATASGQVLRVPMYNTLKPYMTEEAIMTGDEFVVTVSGITSLTGAAFEGADAQGNAVFTYLCGSLPVVVTKQYVPETVLSYWAPGAPEGIIRMEFDADLIDDGNTTVELGWGNAEGNDGEYYAEKIVCKIEGSVLTADLTGKLRTPATMTPMFPNAMYSTMKMDVQNVRDSYGVPVASPGLGTTGSYSFMPRYQLIDRSTLIAEFAPLSGSALKSVNDINIWMTGLDAVTFEGFTLTVTGNDNKVTTRNILLSDVKVTPSGTNEAEYDFSLPADIKESAKRVEITLYNVKTLDGYDHNNDVRCVYGGFAVLYAEPANREEIEILKADTEVYIETNLTDEYPDLFVMYQIVDTDPENTDPIVKQSAWMNHQGGDAFSAIIPQDVKLYAGHDYRVEFTAWQDEATCWTDPDNNLGTDFIIWKGLTPAYRFSLLELKSFTPSTDEMMADDTKEIKLEFDGYVSLGNYDEKKGALRTFIIQGQGTTLPFASVTPIQPIEVEGTQVATEWILAIPEGYVASLTAPFEIAFTAYDQDGIQLRGNEGLEENSVFHFQWNVAGQFAEVAVAAVGDQTPLGNVKQFTVSHADGISMSWNDPIEYAVVTLNGETVAHVADAAYPETDPDDFSTPTEIILTLDTELNVNGEYTLTIPAGYFVIGEQFGVKSSLPVEYVFTIGNAVGPVQLPATFDPESGSVLEALPESIFFDFGEEYIVYGPYADLAITVQKDNETPVELDFEYDYSWPKGQGYIDLEQYAGTKELGTYTIEIPENFFRLGHWSADVEATSTPVEAMTLVYTVKDITGVELVTVKADRYRVYNTAGVLVLDTTDAEALKSLKGLYIVNGFKMILK